MKNRKCAHTYTEPNIAPMVYVTTDLTDGIHILHCKRQKLSNYIKQLWISITSAQVRVKLEGLLS